jgi:phenylalanyl-tRNA synthetase alpha chain
MTHATHDALLTEAQLSLSATQSVAELESWHVRYFGREQGVLTNLLRSIPTLPPKERGTVGKAINQAKQSLELLYQERAQQLQHEAIAAQLVRERTDVTLPARRPFKGSIHPVMATRDELVELFAYYGFKVAEGPEVEDDWHNFTALNTAADHPARDAQDTFYLQSDGPLAKCLLRTQTSSVQIRAMMSQTPPLRLIMPGRVYRRDDVTRRHYPIFHQLEALMVEPGTHFGHLKGLLTSLCRSLFGDARPVRFRPSFFPFTEPSCEVDVGCPFCAGQGCGTCSQSGWIELGGAGMVHPNVLQAVGYDPSVITGLAFGMGIDRVAMIRYGVNDIRHLWENDDRFLRQF